jgi:DNA topoisomerase-3
MARKKTVKRDAKRAPAPARPMEGAPAAAPKKPRSAKGAPPAGGRTLIVAEKPSVAREIARALGGFRFADGYAESPEYLLTWAVGHLLEFEPPEVLRPELARRWRCESLPVLPESFRLVPRQERGGAAQAARGAKGGAGRGRAGAGGTQLRIVGSLLEDSGVACVINACDAGREGERIFRTLTEHFRSVAPTRRLWVNAMTHQALRDGFARLVPGESKDDLARAAACRSEADWLVGMNGTMAFTARLKGRSSARGAASVYSLGRVQTPTLALVVDRDLAIRAFRPESYWEVEAAFRQDRSEYKGRWFDPSVREVKDGPSPHRIASREEAEAIVARVSGREGRVEEESRRVTHRPPLLFDLTSLQAEANRRFHLSPKTTLETLEKLYLAGRISYPRTGCRYLASADAGLVARIVQALGRGPYASFVAGVEPSRLEPSNRRLFNDAEVKKEDHTAIVPTEQIPAQEPDGIAGRLYDVVARSLLAALHPDAVSDEVTRTTIVGADCFRSRGRVLRVAGWRAVHGASADEEGAALPPVDVARPVDPAGTEILDLETRPPARYSEATLLKAMETAGREIDEEDLREAMKERGLGTPATRAEILDKLFQKSYLERDPRGRELSATAKGVEFIEILRRLDLPELTRAELTGEWEHKLRLMERGAYERARFMAEIREMTVRMVSRACGASLEEFFPAVRDLPACPRCGDELTATPRTYACKRGRDPECPFFLPRIIAGRPLSAAEIGALVQDGSVGPLDGFRSAKGNTFSAEVAVKSEGGVELRWERRSEPSERGDPVDAAPVGRCPVCGGDVLVYEGAYRCSSAGCRFSVPESLLGSPLPPEQMRKLLAGERTDLLTMQSRKTGRMFQTWLRLGKGGKLAFEFPPRPGRSRRAAPVVGARRVRVPRRGPSR